MRRAIAAYPQPVPIGVSLSFRASRTIGKRVTILNAGEQVLRGPVAFPGFQIHKIVFLGNGPNGRLFALSCPGFRPQDLMPARPFEPTRLTIARWFNQLDDWYRNYTVRGHSIVRGRAMVGAVEAPTETTNNNAPPQNRQRRGSI